MRIGFDLDNTLICYDQLFAFSAHKLSYLTNPPAQKQALKSALMEKWGPQEGESAWQDIQAHSYGPWLEHAELFPNVLACLEHLANQGHQLFIVSHKSSHSHFRPAIGFWEPARQFLNTHHVCKWVPDSQLFFEQTRQSKIQRITDLKLDLFVDDLADVLKDPFFPANTQGLCFAGDYPISCSTWNELEIALTHWTWLNDSLGGIKTLARIPSRGNGLLFKLNNQNQAFVLKVHYQPANDPRNRCGAEWRFLNFLAIRDVPAPRPIACQENALLMTFISATTQPVAPANLTAMLIRLAEVSKAKESSLEPAAHARFRLRDFAHDLLKRLETLEEPLNRQKHNHPWLQDFITITSKTAQTFLQALALNKESDQPLARPFWIASPSDFGPHNACLDQRGQLCLYDFEYAGWDDPVKLLADFYWHLAFDWSREERMQVINSFLQYRSVLDPTLKDRLHWVLPLVGLEWVLIALNVLNSDQMIRKHRLDPTESPHHRLKARQDGAQQLFQEWWNTSFKPFQELV